MPLECAAWFSDGIAGSNEKGGREDSSVVIELNHEIYKPVDTQMGIVSGTRVHGSVDLVKEVDTASIPLLQALCQNTPIASVEIKWYRVTDTGSEELYFTQLLEGVKVAAMETILPNTKESKKEKFRHLERLSLLYEKITWTHEEGFEYYDAWKEEATA